MKQLRVIYVIIYITPHLLYHLVILLRLSINHVQGTQWNGLLVLQAVRVLYSLRAGSILYNYVLRHRGNVVHAFRDSFLQ